MDTDVKKKRKSPPEYIEPEEKVKMLTEHFNKFCCEYLGRPRYEHKGDMKFRAVRFRSCGHAQDVAHTNSLKGIAKCGPTCKQCQTSAKQSLFDKHNFIVIDQITKDKFLVKKPCGHVSHAYVNAMKRSDKIVCSECVHEKHLVCCENVGVDFIKPTTPTKATYKFKCCGTEKDLYRVAIDRGNCVCPACGNGWMTKPSKLYLFEIEKDSGEVFLKFGYGKDLNNRVREYRLKNCKLKSNIFSVDMPTGFLAMKEEIRIHSEIGEKLDPLVMKQYLTGGGYTECYDYTKLNLILNKMKEVGLQNEQD
jgi:hypothetical protein